MSRKKKPFLEDKVATREKGVECNWCGEEMVKGQMLTYDRRRDDTPVHGRIPRYLTMVWHKECFDDMVAGLPRPRRSQM